MHILIHTTVIILSFIQTLMKTSINIVLMLASVYITFLYCQHLTSQVVSSNNEYRSFFFFANVTVEFILFSKSKKKHVCLFIKLLTLPEGSPVSNALVYCHVLNTKR